MGMLSGQTFKGYEIHESIGQGAFGAVYRAHQTVVDREVASRSSCEPAHLVPADRPLGTRPDACLSCTPGCRL